VGLQILDSGNGHVATPVKEWENAAPPAGVLPGEAREGDDTYIHRHFSKKL